MLINKTLVVYVPSKCNYSCPFCPYDRIGEDEYNNISDNPDNMIMLKERMQFARNAGYNNLLITSNGEPTLNKKYIQNICMINSQLPNPFFNIELKTNGSLLNNDTLQDLKKLNIKTICLMLSSVFKSQENNATNNANESLNRVDIEETCERIKKNKFNLRLNLLLTEWYKFKSLEHIFDMLTYYKADEVSLKILVPSENEQVSDWIERHRCDEQTIERIREQIENNYNHIGITSQGDKIFSIKGISTVFDDYKDAIDIENINTLYINTDCRIYSNKNDKGSLIF